MSGGEKQRVAVARALFQQPELYFADEPVSSLDAYYAGRVLGLLRQEADERAKPVVCVLHNAEHIQRFADLALSLNLNDPTAHKLRRIRHETTEASP
jgi:phosphonate transport system ATP-binding protein